LLAKKFLVLTIFLVGITVFGCARTGAIPRGWSGAVVADSTLFLGSMEGQLVALNTANGVRVWPQDFTMKTSAPAGGFGCAPGSTVVAIYGTPAVGGDLVYAGGYDGKIYALNTVSGDLRWVYPREGKLQAIVGGPAVSQGKVYIASANRKVYALEATTGDKKWEFQTGDKIWSTPAVSGDTVYIGSFDKKLYALNAADGSKRWEFATEGAIVSMPLVYNNTVYIGSFDRHLYALSAADGSLKWKSDFIAGKWFWAGAVSYNNTIYAPSLDGKVYVVDAQTGGKIAEPYLGAPISSSPVIVGKLVIAVTEDGVVYALDTDNNQAGIIATLKTPNDKEEQINAPLSASDGVVYIHTQTKQHETVYAMTPETGEMLWSIPLASQ
jgi:outer membrane protein assembly factor BamB